MTRVFDDKWVVLGSMLYLSLAAYFILQDRLEVLLVPLLLGLLLISFYRPEYLLYTIVISTPFSINLEELELGGFAFYLPTEPLLFGLTVLLILGHLHGPLIPKDIIRHPISRAMFLYLGWMFVTSLTSTDPVVSLKFLLSRLWFIVPMYFGGATLFLNLKKANKFLLLYLIPFLVVVCITLFKHWGYGFEEEPAHWVMEPLYRDHTQYGAVVALFIPIAFGFTIEKDKTLPWRGAALLALSILCVAVVYTYARASWLSVLFALLLWILAILKVRPRLVVLGGLLFTLLLLFSLDDILVQLQKNKTDSSENLVENVESITNITTDASNLERINRWNSVFAMVREKPMFGFGPGTYAFEYAPYQKSTDLTIISTNFGDVGNAHSEYLGPLAESGIIGLLSILLLITTLFWTGFNAYQKLDPGPQRHLLLMVTLALTTYFTHGFLNNFLDSDKASVPVFGMMGIIVAIDVLRRRAATIKSS